MKANPNRSCNCSMCRRGRRTSGGHAQTRSAERAFRQHARRSLSRDPYEFETIFIATGYTD